jgi:hypothetical protein
VGEETEGRQRRQLGPGGAEQALEVGRHHEGGGGPLGGHGRGGGESGRLEAAEEHDVAAGPQGAPGEAQWGRVVEGRADEVHVVGGEAP